VPAAGNPVVPAAVQADYFAARIATHDLTGIAGAAGNQRGLADAEAHLT
jgi:hypothetical protein